MGMGRGIPARVYADNKAVTDWVAGFQPAFTQIIKRLRIGSRDSSPRLCRYQVVMGLGRGILARVYAGDKRLWEWVAGFQPAFMQVTSGYGNGSRDSSPRLRRNQVLTLLGRGIPARVYVDIKCLRYWVAGF